jgi:hypothetical protein
MSIPYTSGDFTSARANGESWIEYPFIEYGDNTTKVYHLVCEVNEVDYAPIALDTTMASASNADVISLPFTADAAAYHVGDFGKIKIDGGLTRFDRQFANIPSVRNDSPSGTTAYTYPGISSNDTDGTERTVTAASNAANVTTLTCTNTVSAGDTVYINIVTSTGSNIFTSSGFYIALTGTSGSVVKIPAIIVGTTFESGTLTELTIQPKAQKSIPTGSLSDYSYFLPGVSAGITDPTDVEETPVFAPFSAQTGETVNTLSELTIPNSSSYSADVAARNFIVIASNVTRWRGNILQKQNVRVRAL